MSAGWVPALISSGAVSAAGHRLEALTARAAVAATVVGASILRGGGWSSGLLLAVFFTSGTALPRVLKRGRQFKSDRARNERQVLANGGVAAVAGLLSPLTGDGRALTAIAGSLSAATADTWATEIGSTSQAIPRMILSRKPVTAGLSGGVTARGNTGALAGAMLAGGLAGALTRERNVAVAVTVAGLVGTTVDSLLGELVQARYIEHGTGTITESPEIEGQPARLVSGKRWVDNDAVNLICTLSGALTAVLIRDLLRRR